MRLVDDHLTPVAGRADEEGDADGLGPAARLSGSAYLASDGAGSIYCSDDYRIRRIQLPAAWRAAAVPHHSAAGAAGAAGAQAGAGAGQAVVSTLPYEAPDSIKGLVFVPARAKQEQQTCGQTSSSSSSSSNMGRGWLILGTSTALHRLPMPLPVPVAAGRPAGGHAAAGRPAGGHAAAGRPAGGHAAAGRPAGGHAAAGSRPAGGHAAAGRPAGGHAAEPLQTQLQAGSTAEGGYADGRGSAARLTNYSGLVADADGNIYLADGYKRHHNDDDDDDDDDDGCRVRRVSPDGTVTTLVTDLPGDRFWLSAILPNGYLALGISRAVGAAQLLLVDLGLTPVLPQLPAAADAPAGPPPRSLPADLGALLDAQPDGTADLTIRVGERRFHAHRAILSARCDYFKQRLAGDGFADARAAELELPDADPAAFALLLRWLYTGSATVPPDQARGVAELADRLLLPPLCAVAQGVVAASVTAGSVVDCLLWAAGCCESRGSGRGFGRLLARLKEWYVRHHEEVRREAGPSRQRLAATAPALTEELMDMLVDWERDQKRQRR